MRTKEIAEKLSYLEKKVLLAMDGVDEASPEEILDRSGLDKLVEVMNGISWNQMKGLLTVEEKVSKTYYLSSKDRTPRKLPERKVLEALYSGNGEGLVSDLERNGVVSKDEVSAAVGWMKKKGWAHISKAADGSVLLKLTDDGKGTIDRKGIDENLLDDLMSKEDLPAEDCDPKAVEMLKGRKGLLLERPVVSRKVRLTEDGKEILRVGLEIKDEIGQLTPGDIQSQKWKSARIREYDIEAFAPSINAGKLHPLTILINQMRDAFLKMGFSEIKGDYVESAFWNMDVLFTAQDHPVRDLHDTFYLKKPEELNIKEKELVEIIRQVHENGWETGSKGWGYKWSLEEAQKMLLRTHTTVNTIRYLSKHNEPPIKVFSIGRVFRNEAIDIRHLPEFTQVEGIICEDHADMNMLATVLKEFYSRMGIEDIRIRPGYFPYTEPSLEVDILYSGKWMELGGAGIFRPEVTEPHGVKHPVLAWGLGLERLAMLKWKLTDIRELYVSDVDWLRKASIL